MTINIEEELAVGMRQEVAGIGFATDVVGEARRRHQRRAAARRAVYAAGVAGVAGAVAVVMAAGGGQPGAGTSRPGAAGTEPANLELAAAIAASEKLSFTGKLHIATATVTGHRSEAVFDTAFDPATTTGYERSTDGMDVRLINGTMYRKYLPVDNAFTQCKGTINSLDGISALSKHTVNYGELGSSADPEQLFQMLRQASAKITKVSPDQYHFEVTDKASKMVGDITVNADKRVAKVAYDLTETVQQNDSAGQKGGTHTIKMIYEFSEYGMPVTVEPPTGPIVVKVC